jgi:hypothetical protein
VGGGVFRSREGVVTIPDFERVLTGIFGADWQAVPHAIDGTDGRGRGG